MPSICDVSAMLLWGVVLEMFAVIAFFGAMIVLFRLGKTARHQKPFTRPTQLRPPPKTHLPPSIEIEQPPRFDADRAVHLDERRVLTGRAYVVDGDTIKVAKTQVRLFGVDAPELNHPYGKKAKWDLLDLCKDQTIRAEITDVDDHGRTVARCFLPDGRDLSAEMVKQGLAIDWPKFSGGVYRHLEGPDLRRKLFLADARQKGRMDVWEKFEAKERSR